MSLRGVCPALSYVAFAFAAGAFIGSFSHICICRCPEEWSPVCRRPGDERGFTIMELLVVMALIGLIAALGLPAYRSITAQSGAVVCGANRRTLDSATGVYYGDKAAYPSAVGELAPYLDNTADIRCPTGGAYSIDAATHKWVCDKH